MIRTLSLSLAIAAAVVAGPAGAQVGTRVPAQATTALAPSQGAGWICHDRRCTYNKAQGAWSDCFTSWSPTHGGWLPTRYCR